MKNQNTHIFFVNILSYKKMRYVTVATIQQGHRLHDEQGAAFHKCDCIMDNLTCNWSMITHLKVSMVTHYP